MKTMFAFHKWMTALAVGAAVLTMAANTAMTADTAEPVAKTLITNARVFDGMSDKLTDRMSVLVEGNKIAKIAKSIPAPSGATVIDARGRTLMPGLIDAHYHPMFAAIGQMDALASLDGYLNLVAAKNAEQLLLQGFISLREASGNSFSLKRAIDQGLYSGPRIYPTGPMISQTSGHADYRPATSLPYDPHATLSYLERSGHALLADGVPEIIRDCSTVTEHSYPVWWRC